MFLYISIIGLSFSNILTVEYLNNLDNSTALYLTISLHIYMFIGLLASPYFWFCNDLKDSNNYKCTMYHIGIFLLPILFIPIYIFQTRTLTKSLLSIGCFVIILIVYNILWAAYSDNILSPIEQEFINFDNDYYYDAN